MPTTREGVMKHLRRRLIPICAVAAVAAVGALAAASATGSVGSCAHLSAKMTVVGGSAGAGHISYKLTLKNSGPGSCRVDTHPGLKLLKANGAGLPTHVTKVGPSGSVLIKAGKSASAQLRFSPDVPGPGEPSHGPCEPAAHKIKIIASTPVVGPISPATPVCEHGAIQQKPLG
jgi:Domain of unknown function (DUF4232)